MPKKQTQHAKTFNSYTSTRYNATKHGALSCVPVLPWENAEDFDQLQDELIIEYSPQGASEKHLVLEIANCIFRKQRIYRAENALIMKNISRSSSYSLKEAAHLLMPHIDLDTSFQSQSMDFKSILHDNNENDQGEDLKAHKKYLAEVQVIIDSDFSYEEMLKKCPTITVELWNDWVNDEESDYTPDKQSFKKFLVLEIVKWCESNSNEVQARPFLKQQLVGLSYVTNNDMDHLQRHETTLDRRLEKSLIMLLKLQEIRLMRSGATISNQAVNSVL